MLLKDKLQGIRILLASQSPRRRELMSGCDLPYELAPKFECDEVYPQDLAKEEVSIYLSQLKSKSYPHPLSKGEVLLTADTIVLLEGEVLGKPHSREEAIEMLSRLSGHRHSVITGVTLRTQDRTHSFKSESYVWFREMSLEEIEYYVDTYHPFDKAGAYGIQEWIGYAAIEKIEGSFYNVMGLPIQKVYTELNKFLSL